MKELAIWAGVTATLALLVWAGVPFEPLVGTLALLMFFAWIVVEFFNITRWLAKLSAHLVGEPSEPAPDSVDRTLGKLDRSEGEYAGTRNDKQRRKP